jgi:hypothetical protein
MDFIFNLLILNDDDLVMTFFVILFHFNLKKINLSNFIYKTDNVVNLSILGMAITFFG